MIDALAFKFSCGATLGCQDHADRRVGHVFVHCFRTHSACEQHIFEYTVIPTIYIYNGINPLLKMTLTTICV